jgi:tyrosine phenol-lyase
VGGHAIFVDALAFYPHIPQNQFPAQTLAAMLYLDSGIRSMERGIVSAGRDPATGDHRYPRLELTRLTIPRRVYTQAHMDVVAESVKAVFDMRKKTKGLRMVYEPKYLRFFQAKFEPL